MSQINNKQLAEFIETSVSEGKSEEALKCLDELISAGEDAELYYIRGRLEWKLGRKTDAISDYSKAVAIDENSPAAQALSMAREIMDFYNHDIYNP